MQKHEYNEDMDMKFMPGLNWLADIWLPADAQIAEIHLRVYSFGYPDFVYGLSWGTIKTNKRHLQIPVEAFRAGHSRAEEAVRLAVDITYYTAR